MTGNHLKNNMFMRVVFFFLIIVSTLVPTMATCSKLAIAGSPVRAYFAGIAFASDYKYIKTAFPYTNKLLEEKNDKGIPLLEAKLASLLGNIKNPNLSLTSQLGNYKSGEAVSIALAIDWENVSIEKVGGNVKVVIDLHSQILVFDFSEMKLINSFPIRVQIIHSQDGDENDKEILEIFRNIFYSSTGHNVFNEFVKRLNKVSIKPAYGNRIRVDSVILEEKALNTIAEAEANSDEFSSFVARSFSQTLSNNQFVAVLPYSKGQAIGSKMSARFANGDVYELEIPKPDYTITIIVRGFKKVIIDQTLVETAWAYASYLRLKIEQPELSKIYMDAKFKYASSKTVPRTHTELDDWTAYRESLFALFDQITKQVSSPNRKWINKWSDSKHVPSQFKKVDNLLAKCR